MARQSRWCLIKLSVVYVPVSRILPFGALGLTRYKPGEVNLVLPLPVTERLRQTALHECCHATSLLLYGWSDEEGVRAFASQPSNWRFIHPAITAAVLQALKSPGAVIKKDI